MTGDDERPTLLKLAEGWWGGGGGHPKFVEIFKALKTTFLLVTRPRAFGARLIFVFLTEKGIFCLIFL